jgi:hypothetical protein
MTPEQTALRFDSRLSQIKYRKFRKSQIDENDIKIWEKKIKEIQRDSLKIIGVSENCNCRLIESELDNLSGTFVPDLVVVDYAGIMTPNNSNGMTSSMDWKYIGEIIKNLKDMALKLDIPVWSACQILVESKKKANVSFVDVGLARQQIAAHSDICIAIIQTPQMEAMGTAKLQFVKAREGCEERHIDIRRDYDRISLERRTE